MNTTLNFRLSSLVVVALSMPTSGNAANFVKNNSSYSSPNTAYSSTRGSYRIGSGAVKQPTSTYKLFSSKSSASVGTDPFTCDLTKIAANWDSSASLAKLSGPQFKSFVSESAKNMAFNSALDGGQAMWAAKKCEGPLYEAEAAKALVTATAAYTKKLEADIATQLAGMEELKVGLVGTAVAAGGGATSTITSSFVPNKNIALAKAKLTAAIPAKVAAWQAQWQDEHKAKCVEAAKKEFMDYTLNAFSLLNGDFWADVNLKAAQCRLKTEMQQRDTVSGLEALLKKYGGDGNGTVNLGLFTVEASAGSGGVTIGANKKVLTDTHAAVVDATVGVTDTIDSFFNNKDVGHLFISDAERDRWVAFKKDLDAALVPQEINMDIAVQDVFSMPEYSINPVYVKDVRYADYHINEVKGYYTQFFAEARANQNTDKSIVDDTIKGGMNAGVARLQMTLALKAIKGSSLRSEVLLSRILRAIEHQDPSKLDPRRLAQMELGVTVTTDKMEQDIAATDLRIQQSLKLMREKDVRTAEYKVK